MKRYLLLLSCVILRSAGSFAAESATPVIRQYVTKTRHWLPSAYRIERKEKEDRYIIYYVIALVDEHQRTPQTGTGQSFAVYYDPHSQQIVREMHFQ
jgi:hypothetical protein